jgi:GGDEF domain-containing protein
VTLRRSRRNRLPGRDVLLLALLDFDAVGELAPAAEFLLSGAVAAIMLRLVLAVREVRGLEHNRVEARTDELTGLANRREFYASGDQAGTASATSWRAAAASSSARTRQNASTTAGSNWLAAQRRSSASAPLVLRPVL